MVGEGGFEPSNPKEQIYSLPRLTVSLLAHYYADRACTYEMLLVEVIGLGPMTFSV